MIQRFERNVSDTSIGRIAIFGEVLWDCFEKGRVLGGAPFNVAWNLAGFGEKPYMISAVGDDPMGQEILARMQAWGMSTRGIDVSNQHATGTVQVTLDHGEPSYDITKDVAWDWIPCPDSLPESLAYFYHGSLAWRSEANRRTVLRLRQESSAKVFVDVNIRKPHFSESWIDPMLRGAACVKLNIEELGMVASFAEASLSGEMDMARYLLNHYHIEQLVVTHGASGAKWFGHDGDSFFVEAPKPTIWVDAVGAGDALASVFLHGLIYQRDPEETLRDAVRFAADVCGLSGATTSRHDFYQRNFIE